MKKVTIYFAAALFLLCNFQLSAQQNNLKRMWTSPYVLNTHNAKFSFQIETESNVAPMDSIQVVVSNSELIQAGTRSDVITFFDDGLENDLKANDKIYTASNLEPIHWINEQEIKIKPTFFPYILSEMNYFSDGNKFSEQPRQSFPVRWFDPSVVPGVNQINANFQHTSHVVNIVDENLEDDVHDLDEAFEKYYQHLPDDRHSMIVVATEVSYFTGSNWGQSIVVSNDIQGIGMDIFDYSDDFHSNGVLEQRIFIRGGSETNSVFTHELHHRWGIRMPQEFNMTSGGHWSGIFEMNGGGAETDRIEKIESNGDSTYNVYYNWNKVPGTFNPIDLYLAGYGPFEDIKFPIKVLPNSTYLRDNPDGSAVMYSEDSLQFITKDLFVEKMGIRVPDYLNARREQRVGMMVRSRKLLTPEELAFFHTIMVEHEKTENSIYSPGSYFELSMGQGRLITRISGDIVSVEEEMLGANKFNIFPNPASTELSIESFSKEKFSFQSGQILNSTGQIVSDFKFENGTKVDIQNLTPGVYFLRLKTLEGAFSKLFLKTAF